MMNPGYAPFYCEENIYRLARGRSESRTPAGAVILISNPTRSVALTESRLGTGRHRLVIWDYHVIYAEADSIYDLDTALSVPSPIAEYWRATFPRALQDGGDEYAARFSIVPRERYLEVFSSDRSHMLDSRGEYLKPPPPWPAIFDPARGSTLFALVDGDHPAVVYHGQSPPLQSLL